MQNQMQIVEITQINWRHLSVSDVHIAYFCSVNMYTKLVQVIIIIILFESGNMAHTQTHIDMQTDRQTDIISKKSTIKHSKSQKNADGLAHRSSFTRSLLCLLQTYRKDFL